MAASQGNSSLQIPKTCLPGADLYLEQLQLACFYKVALKLVDSKRNILLNLVLSKLRVSEVDFNSNVEEHKPSRCNKVNTSRISINTQNTASTRSIPHLPSQAPPSPFKAIDCYSHYNGVTQYTFLCIRLPSCNQPKCSRTELRSE